MSLSYLVWRGWANDSNEHVIRSESPWGFTDWMDRMRNKSLLFLSLFSWTLLGAAESGLVLSEADPGQLAPIDKLTTVSRQSCNLLIFGWIPTKNTTLDQVLTDMSAGAHGLTDVHVKSIHRGFLLLNQHCWKISATPYRWRPIPPPPIPNCEEDEDEVDAPPATEATAEDSAEVTPEPAPVETAAVPPVVVATLTVAPPKKAFALTARLYQALGKNPPADESAWEAIVAEVWTIRQQNDKSDGDMVVLVRKGSGLAGPEATVLEALKQAVETEPKH
jgi:hypothetical protein